MVPGCSGTTAIAIYAAVIGTLGLAWQVYSWRRANSTKVRVKLADAFIPGITEHAAMITAINQSSHMVKVTSVGFIAQDGSKRDVLLTTQSFGATLPGPVEPRDSGMAWLDIDEAARAGIDIYRPLVGWVRTSDDQRFESKPAPLLRR
jgi:hypothetical protein